MQTDRMFVKSPQAVLRLLLVVSVQSAFSRPVHESNKSRAVRSTPIFEDVQGYLTKFGYLPDMNLETANLQSDEQLQDALRTLQTYGRIPVTGKMDAATKQLIRMPRCGNPDVIPRGQNRIKRHTLQGQKWDHVNVTWSLRTRYFSRMDHGWVRSDLRKALQVWSKHSKLTFLEVNSESADILVSFEKGHHGDSNPFDGPGQVLAHAFFPGSGRGGDAHFDVEEDWLLLKDEQTKDGTSLFTAAAHEFGHSLGLAHSWIAGSLMYPWYQSQLDTDFELPDDDRLGIQILYGSKEDKMWGDIPVYRPISQRPDLPRTTPTTTTTSARTRTTVTATAPQTTGTTMPTAGRTSSSRRPDAPKIPPSVDDKPDFCNTSFDAVSIIRKDTYFFNGKYMWRIGPKGLFAGYPALINRVWYSLPDDLTHVDAVYERQDGKIVFFIGRRYYLFSGNTLLQGYPKRLTELGLPEELDHVDAAAVWGHNSATYIFSGTMYWKYDNKTDKMELDYPRDMSIWRGVGYNINAAFQWHDGATYFFKNRAFWKFDDLRMRVEQEEPRSIGQFWFGCAAAADGDDNGRGRTAVPSDRPSSGGGRRGRLRTAAAGEGSPTTAAAAVSSRTVDGGGRRLLLPLAVSLAAVRRLRL